MEIIIAYCIYALSRFFSGMEDGLVSITEIELAQSGRSEDDRIEDTKRRSKWHFNGGVKLVLTAIAFGIFTYGFSWQALLMFFSILTLQVVIFNPIISVKYLKTNFFYLSPNGWEGHFKGNEKLYYFTNLAVFAACIYFQLKL